VKLQIGYPVMAETDADLVDRMAKRHSVSPAAVQVVMAALRSGGGRMAQFSHADFGGMLKWSPVMPMIGDINAQPPMMRCGRSGATITTVRQLDHRTWHTSDRLPDGDKMTKYPS
jgi:hypothetical protein